MSFWSTPTNIALIILFVFLLVGSFVLIRSIWRGTSGKKDQYVLEIDPQVLNKDNIRNILDNVKTPFSFEIAVHQLGKEIHYYLIVPEVSKRFILEGMNAKLTSEYDIYHSGGTNLGFNLKGKDVLPLINLKDIDFSSINEIGEGALIQLVIGGKSRDGWLVNFRVLVSAPTPYQAQEIALTLNSSLKKFKPVAVTKKFVEFLDRVNFRKFDKDEATVWSN